MNSPSWRSGWPLITVFLRVIAVVCGLVALLSALGQLPDLPGAESAYLSPLNTLLGALVALVASFGTGKASNALAGAPAQRKYKRYRANVLGKVETYWIDGLLDNSLHNSVLIQLGMESTPRAVEPQALLQLPEQPEQHLPEGTKITDVFDEARGTLLILGEPGSGKTTMLLEIARRLIDRAKQDENQPIPVVFNLSRWAEKQLSIAEWLVDELNIQYLVSKDLCETWIEDEEVLPLLDGLDEVSREHLAACVEAINRFRQEHNAVNMAVCSRTADYDVIGARLDLNGAVLLQQLTWEQCEYYLTEVGGKSAAVQANLHEDRELQELIRTPLWLNVICLLPDEVVAVGSTPQERRTRLWNAYIRRMLEVHRKLERPIVGKHQIAQKTWIQRVLRWLRGPDARKEYAPQQTIQYLSYLARMMRHHNQTIFLMEQIQPDWLPTDSQDWVHRTRSQINRVWLGSLVLVLVGGLLILGNVVYLLRANLMGVGEQMPVLLLSFLFLLPLLSLYLVVIGSLIVRGILRMISRRANQHIRVREAFSWSWSRALSGLLLVLLGSVTVPVFIFNELSIVTFSLIVALLLCAAAVVRGFPRREVESTRSPTLSWSWSRALSGLPWVLLGAFAGLVVFLADQKRTELIYFPDDIGSVASSVVIREPSGLVVLLFIVPLALSAAVLRGFHRREVESRSSPNQGIRRQARNALLMGVFMALCTSSLVIVWWLWDVSKDQQLQTDLSSRVADFLLLFPLILLFVGIPVSVIVAFYFGAFDCVKHVVIRLLLYRDERVPWNYPAFLDYATERALLRRVGGGYIFVHGLLQEHFAAKEIS